MLTEVLDRDPTRAEATLPFEAAIVEPQECGRVLGVLREFPLDKEVSAEPDSRTARLPLACGCCSVHALRAGRCADTPSACASRVSSSTTCVE